MYDGGHNVVSGTAMLCALWRAAALRRCNEGWTGGRQIEHGSTAGAFGTVTPGKLCLLLPVITLAISPVHPLPLPQMRVAFSKHHNLVVRNTDKSRDFTMPAAPQRRPPAPAPPPVGQPTQTVVQYVPVPMPGGGPPPYGMPPQGGPPHGMPPPGAMPPAAAAYAAPPPQQQHSAHDPSFHVSGGCSFHAWRVGGCGWVGAKGMEGGGREKQGCGRTHGQAARRLQLRGPRAPADLACCCPPCSLLCYTGDDFVRQHEKLVNDFKMGRMGMPQQQGPPVSWACAALVRWRRRR